MIKEMKTKSYGSNMDIFWTRDDDNGCINIVKSDYDGLSDDEKVESVLEHLPDLSQAQKDKLYLDLQIFFNL